MVKKGDVLKCENCGIELVCVDPCGCSACGVVCCEELMTVKKAKTAKTAAKASKASKAPKKKR